MFQDVLTDFDSGLDVFEFSSFVKENFQGCFETFVVVGGGRDVNFAVGENWILGVHKFVQKYSQRISVKCLSVGCWGAFEIDMVEIWHLCPIDKNGLNVRIKRNWFSNLWDPIFNVDIPDVEHIN